MLIDKGYYDYDYEKPDERAKSLKAVKNNDDLKDLLKSMGISSRKDSERDLRSMDMEQLQAYAIDDAKDNKID